MTRSRYSLGVMIYHPTWRDRFVYLLILATCIGLVVASGILLSISAAERANQFREALIVTSLLLAAAAYINKMAWDTTVRLHDGGVEWKDGQKTRELAWDGIVGLGWKTERKVLKIGLIEKETKELQVLPFFSAPLYEALKPRCGRLPAETEKILGFKS